MFNNAKPNGQIVLVPSKRHLDYQVVNLNRKGQILVLL
jgi:hypothetical protein